MAALASLLFSGCSTINNLTTGNVSDLQLRDTSVYISKFDDLSIPLRCKEDGRVYTLSVVYHPTSTAAFTNNSSLVRPVETAIMLTSLFLQDQALRFAEGRSTSPSVSVTAKGTNAIPESVRHAGNFWFSESSPFAPAKEYCQRTGAVRSAEGVHQLLPLKETESDVWIPLNRETYDAWWTTLDRGVDFSHRFGNEPTGNPAK
jgi:hypothetical protein